MSDPDDKDELKELFEIMNRDKDTARMFNELMGRIKHNEAIARKLFTMRTKDPQHRQLQGAS